VPLIVGKVVADIDAIVKEVRWESWNDTESDKAVRIAIHKVLVRYGLPASGELFDAHGAGRRPAAATSGILDCLWHFSAGQP
jgi:hypothetical protein